MIAIRPKFPIFMQNRKAYGSFLGHTKELPGFRNHPNFQERCDEDAVLCDKLFDINKAQLYGFTNRMSSINERTNANVSNSRRVIFKKTHISTGGRYADS